jgi:hypothetical protein
MILELLIILIFYDWNTNHKFNQIVEDFFKCSKTKFMKAIII